MPDNIEKKINELPISDPIIDDSSKDNNDNKNIRMLTPEDLGVKKDDIDVNVNKNEELKKEIMKDVPENDLKVGIEIEKEHEPTVNKIKEYLEKNGKLPPNEMIYEWISLDHISEFKKYYNDKIGLPAMERKLKDDIFHDREHNEASVTAKNKKDEDILIEKLSELEHEQWMQWSKDISKKEDLSQDRLNRWKNYWVDYSKLKEDVKEQDRKWAIKVLKIFKEFINNEIKGSIDVNKSKENKMELKDINVNGKIYKGLSDGHNIYFNEIDASELGMNIMEIKENINIDNIKNEKITLTEQEKKDLLNFDKFTE
jgi:hypothetical protein